MEKEQSTNLSRRTKMNKIWQDDAWKDYLCWQKQDKKTLKRINQILRDIDRNGYTGIGKPEALTGNIYY